MSNPSDKPSAAHALLDDVERLLFGRVGGAEQALQAFDGDPLARLRAEAALEEEARAAAPRPVDERARRARRAAEELAALKGGRGVSEEAAPDAAPDAALAGAPPGEGAPAPTPRRRTL